MRRVELFELIRKDHEFGLSKRAIARKRGVHRRTVSQALTSATPPGRKAPVRTSPKLTPAIKAFIDAILEADRKAPRKQRHTARRIWQRVEGAHEKGGVEGENGRFRRRWLVPVPKMSSYEDPNASLIFYSNLEYRPSRVDSQDLPGVRPRRT